MRFNFDLTQPRFNDEVKDQQQQQNKSLIPYSPSSSSTPKDQLQWLPLQDHPLFSSSIGAGDDYDAGKSSPTRVLPRNLMAWDGASRIYFWDSKNKCLHRISVRLGEPDPTSVLAAFPSKVLQADVELDFIVTRISINRNGSALILSVLKSHLAWNVCLRTVPIGSEIYQNSNNAIRVLQAMWHPYSDTHLAVLSSDLAFRIFNLSSAHGLPEQEYYLQPVQRGRTRNASSICPVDFCFGHDHLWDRFSVFILFSDGSVYVLCPVIPFGSVYLWESIVEIYSDAQTFGLKSASSTAVSNSSLAISWLEATFPELNQQEKEVNHISAVKARPHVLIDASLSLQGPLGKVCQDEEDNNGFCSVECDGRSVSLIYDSVGKDSILVTAWSGGQLQIDALADEIQPLWHTGSPPRISFDFHDRILGFAMICESSADQLSVVRLDQPPDYSGWLGHPPPVLRLAIVDLALPKSKDGDPLISMYIDPLIPERIFCLHGGGVDSIVLHFLPFTNQINGNIEGMKTPSVHPVLCTCHGSNASSSPLCGFVVLFDSFGYSWIAAVTSTRECLVLEMKTWNILLPRTLDREKMPDESEEATERITPDIISRDILAGPQLVLVPQSSNLRSITADSIEGRSTLHQYFKLFHENYVEYAHKVYFELKHHGPHLKKIIDNMHTRLHEAQKKLQNVVERQPKLDDRIRRAIEHHESLEDRLHKLRRLPGIHKKPLTRAEREFKAELGTFLVHSFGYIASLEQLSLMNRENSKKVKLIESALKNRQEETAD
ncbi:hypothetical protein Cgig2_001756 [Carnegiea gigantea]|uniref:Nuclear pore complex protein NUP88 n=1 Tax=Carnegiea gigantea TaxID=171969 RepID=A0A9Q1KAP5_9CARY|nr:hypothetical protein Cgig2_001756 [Carnegiea gigantea]